MAYTDIWPCKRCKVVPEIVMLGKNIFIECKVCTDSPTSLEGTSLDEVVSRWNRVNDPTKRGILDRVRSLFGR